MYHEVEFLYIHRGEGHISVGMNYYRLSGGVLIVIPPYEQHQFDIDSSDTAYIRSVLKIKPDLIKPYLQPYPHLKQYYNHLLKSKMGIHILDMSKENHLLPGLFQHLHERILDTPQPEQTQSFILFMLFFLQTLLGSCRTYLDATVKPVNRHSTMMKLIHEWINQRYHDPISLKELSKSLHLSVPYLCRLYREATSKTIMEYVTDKRLSESCYLLKTSNMSVEEIGQKVGFPNFSHFCRTFKDKVGVSPTSFRRNE